MSSDIRDTLWSDIESELEKSADSINPDYIDSRIDELCELEARRSGLRPPETTEAQINAVISRISAPTPQVYKMPDRWLHHFRRRRRGGQRQGWLRLAAVACLVLGFSFLAFFTFNYVHTQTNESSFPEEMIASPCCVSDYCLCSIKEEQPDSEQVSLKNSCNESGLFNFIRVNT